MSSLFQGQNRSCASNVRLASNKSPAEVIVVHIWNNNWSHSTWCAIKAPLPGAEWEDVLQWIWNFCFWLGRHWLSALSLNKGRKDTARREDTRRSPDAPWMPEEVPHKVERGRERNIIRHLSWRTLWRPGSPVIPAQNCQFFAASPWWRLQSVRPVASGLRKGEHEFKLNRPPTPPLWVYNATSSGWTDGFLSAVHFWNRSAVPQSWLPLLFNTPHDWLHSL